ncbi:MAG: 16S rRNA (cytosine(1402)-N(4))-methyltransferase RsmH, partial [Limnospira sp. PMC 1291.21]|uniref:16S rRNA (cytosine(1402)-N(4))-methyltransferase RsmH n=1 Tax=unclassified Limnospira TaxID=2642885 RepID=UPI0028E123C5
MSEKGRDLDNVEFGGKFVHIPVLGRELIEGLAVQEGGHYLDATVGGGGHTRMIFQAAPNVRVTAIDRDLEAIAAAKSMLMDTIGNCGARLKFWHGNFSQYPSSPSQFDGIIADLGVNSHQLDTPGRGFSFRHCGPLDMRMNPQDPLSAAEIINTWDEKQLADIFYTYGEERLSRRIARQIVEKRPFQTTEHLANAIANCVPSKYRYGRIHPATRVFQALRIAVNGELTALETFLETAPTWLKPRGRIGIISFHSLEDRPVKHGFRHNPLLKVLTKKPITPQPDEINQNPRARSAKLRLAERSASQHPRLKHGGFVPPFQVA